VPKLAMKCQTSSKPVPQQKEIRPEQTETHAMSKKEAQVHRATRHDRTTPTLIGLLGDGCTCYKKGFLRFLEWI